jgi:16S rRNA (guanine527-N7)-methyltransferase
VIESVQAAAGRPVSRETFDRLCRYAEILTAEASHQNLVSTSTLKQLWQRHILDSAQLLRFEPAPSAAWVDVGSGAGLPGIVIACMTSSPVTLVESRRLRAEFLRRVVAELGLETQVHHASVERITGKFDVITGRAVASLTRFLTMCDHLSTKNTIWILPKGRSAESELAEARRTWQGDFRVEPSVTDADSKIVVAAEVRAKKR